MPTRPHQRLPALLILVLGVTSLWGCRVTEDKEDQPNLPDIASLWDYNDPEATEHRFRLVLPNAQASGDTTYHGVLLTQIARTYSLRSMFEEAHAQLDVVEPMLDHGGPKLRVNHLLERGRAYNSAGDKDRARPLFVEAWGVAREAGLASLAIDAAHMVAIASDADAALAWNLKALELVESTEDEQAKGWLGPLYNNIGWTYFDRGELDRALFYLEKGLAFRRSKGQARESRIAEWSVARVYRAMGRVDEALAIQLGLLEQIERGAAEPDGYVYEELGEIARLQGQAQQARAHFARAYDTHPE